MSQRVLDTSILINHWEQRFGGGRQRFSTVDSRRWARELIELRQTDIIVTPVVIEFLAGTRSGHELKMARAYLAEFRVADEGRVVQDDWDRARALAERVPSDGHRRQLGDCLIRAIADRL